MPERQIETTKQTAQAQSSADLMGSLIAREERSLSDAFGRKGPELDPVKQAIAVLAGAAVKGKVVPKDVTKRINSAIANLDKMLSDQVNRVIHAPEFRTLEGAWRGLGYLVKNVPSHEKLKVMVLNVSKQEIGATLGKFDAESGDRAWDNSPICKKIFERRFDTPGGEPFGCLVGDYQFDHSPQDVDLLARMSKVCGAAHVPFLASAASGVLGLKSWEKLPDPSALSRLVSTPDYAKWNLLRESPDSRYLALTLPRFLSRLPYGAKTVPVAGFHFEEDLRPDSPDATSHDNYVWSNAAYPMAVNIARSFADTGFCVRIRGEQAGGLVEDLPVHTFPSDDGGVDAKCPTEIAISMRREAELAKLGFMPLSHITGSVNAMFVGAQTVQKPQQYDKTPKGKRATENAELSARLPYIFMASRFAHYLKKMMYSEVGSSKSRAQLEEWLNTWIGQYTSSPESGDDVKGQQPLAEARIEVYEIAGKPGYYEAKAYLKPHIQLEGVEVSLGVVSQLPGSEGN